MNLHLPESERRTVQNQGTATAAPPHETRSPRVWKGTFGALALAGSLLGVVVGCGDVDGLGSASDAGAAEPQFEQLEQPLYINELGLWPNPGVIDVCWENPSAAPANERQWVADAVARTWEASSAVDFVGWGTCTPSSSGVRVLINDSQPIAGQTRATLNFTFREWGCSQLPCQISESVRRFWIEDIAVHEFGHVLGFGHEHDRPDAVGCEGRETGTAGTNTFGTYDPYSIMNYCRPSPAVAGELSATDIAGVFAYYGDTGAAPTCTDGVRNQGENGIDCDGPCPNFCFRADEVVIPARIEAEEAVGSSDMSFGNDGDPECSGFGFEDIEVTGDVGGGCNVTNTEPGEYLDYNILVNATQAFDITARLASTATGRSLRVEIDGTNVSGSLFAPGNGAQTYSDVVAHDVMITRGRHIVRVYMESAGLNFNYLEFKASQTDRSRALIPGRIEAEAYVAERDTTPGNQGDPSACGVFGNTDMERTADPNGGSCHVGWVTSGEWLEYDVYVNETRAFDITARMASPYSNRRIHVEVDGVNMTGSMVAPNQGWQWFEDATAYNVVIPAGDHRLRVYMETDGLNLNYIEFTPSNTNRGRVAIPARIEAEMYVGSSDTTFGNGGNASACGVFGDTDMGPSGDVTGGCTVGWVAPGESLIYDVAVGSVQRFDITARLASAYSGRSIRIEVDGVNVTGSMFAPANGWQSFSNVVRRNIVMSPGIHRVRVYMETDALNLNYIQFAPAGQ